MIEFLLTTKVEGFLGRLLLKSSRIDIFSIFVKLYEQANSKIQVQNIDRKHDGLLPLHTHFKLKLKL